MANTLELIKYTQYHKQSSTMNNNSSNDFHSCINYLPEQGKVQAPITKESFYLLNTYKGKQ